MKTDPVPLAQGPGVRANKSVSALEPTADPSVSRLADQAGLVEIPEQVATENPLRERRLPRPDRQVNLAGRGELLGDLKAGVASTDHQHRTVGKIPRRPVPGA